MVKLTEPVKESMQGIKNYYFATASKDGAPNVVPIAMVKLLDDETILIAGSYFNKTLKNMQENPKVACSYWGEKGGYQIKGTVTMHSSGNIFDDMVAWVKSVKPNLSPRLAVVMKVTDVYQIKPGPDAGKKVL